MIKQYLEEAVRKIEAERDRQCAVVRERVVREKIAPFNTEMDKSLNAAIAALSKQTNETIHKAQTDFEKKKDELTQASEKKKSENASAVIAIETASITSRYNAQISELQKQISKIQE